MLTAPWTLSLVLLVTIPNLVPGIDPGLLEFDRRAVEQGEVWRLLTGSLVHWSGGHFVLDAGAFLIVGLLFERTLGRRYVFVLGGAFTAVGLLLLFHPAIERYRGLSGVAAGQYAAALVAETREQWKHWRDAGGSHSLDKRLALFLPAAAALLFALKLGVEWATGSLMLGTERLGELGRPLPLAHLAGVAGAFAAATWGRKLV